MDERLLVTILDYVVLPARWATCMKAETVEVIAKCLFMGHPRSMRLHLLDFIQTALCRIYHSSSTMQKVRSCCSCKTPLLPGCAEELLQKGSPPPLPSCARRPAAEGPAAMNRRCTAAWLRASKRSMFSYVQLFLAAHEQHVVSGRILQQKEG